MKSPPFSLATRIHAWETKEAQLITVRLALGAQHLPEYNSTLHHVFALFTVFSVSLAYAPFVLF